MANTYSQIYVHIVFAVQGRQNIIPINHKEELHKYISGIIREKKQKHLAINCLPDHLHLLINIKPDIALSNLVRDIKNNSSKFINKSRWIRGKFNWQEGFGAFSYAYSQITAVVNYIRNQEKRHAATAFRTEYLELIKKFDVEYDERYLFEWIDRFN